MENVEDEGGSEGWENNGETNGYLKIPDGNQFNGGDNGGDCSSIFAVNSNVHFLYMIGEICAQSGHNLFEGL